MPRNVEMTEADYIGNLTIAARGLSEKDLGIGRTWYRVAAAQVRELAAQHGIPFETACYAVAAVSPGVPWIGALAAFVDLARARALGATEPPRGAGRWSVRDRPKAWAILAGEDPTVHCRGIKVEAFAANLMGDLDQVAVDRHVTRAATRQDIDQLNPRQATEVANAVAVVARMILDMRPAEFQAALWARSTHR